MARTDSILKAVWRGESDDGYETVIEPMPDGEYAVWQRSAIFQSLADAEFSVGKTKRDRLEKQRQSRGSGPLPGGTKGWHPLRETDRERKFSMTYGQIPPFKRFERDIRRPDPDHDGRAYWPAGTLYPMELVGSHEVEFAENYGELEPFDTERRRTGRNSRAIGFRGDEKQIYGFIAYLAGAWNDGDDEAGDLASSIMYTLGYEWV
jgi:hypothetical protein